MDGNKRTAFWAANEFLKDLGTAGFTQGTVDTTNSDIAMNPIDDAHSRVAQGSLDEAGLSARLFIPSTSRRLCSLLPYSDYRLIS